MPRGDQLTSDPRAALAAVLRESGPTVPLLALRHAADWAARAVLDEVSADDMAAFECVVALDDALPPVSELMSQVPALVKLASAGSGVAERLKASAAELNRQRTLLAGERAGLEAARGQLARLAEIEAERERLRAEIGRAERAALIERELPALRQALAEISAAVSAAGAGNGPGAGAAADPADADAVVQGLIAAGRRLAGLSAEQQAILAEAGGQLATEAAEAAAAVERARARRDELAAELQAREQEAAELRAEEERVLPGLRARCQADAELAAALAAPGTAFGAAPGAAPGAVSGAAPGAAPGAVSGAVPGIAAEPAGQAAGWPGRSAALERVRAELGELAARLESAEGTLAPLLRQHQQAFEAARQVRGLSG
jgi:hypothetical protein